MSLAINLFWKSIIALTLFLIVAWLIATILVSRQADGERLELANTDSDRHALILFNPDPITNFDVQVCTAFGEELYSQGWDVRISPYSQLLSGEVAESDLLVICSNTYNFAPDRSSIQFLRSKESLEDKPVVVLTLGSGSTKRAQKILEEKIDASGAMCMGSRPFWLMKPNNIYRLDEDNEKVAIDMVKEFAREVLVELEY